MTLEDSLKVERKEWLAEGRAEGREEGEISRGYKSVEQLVASGLADEEKACEVLGVELSDYQEYITNKN